MTTDAKGRTLLWGWVPDFPKGRGWNGCLTLPREVTVTPDGLLAFAPAKELEALRGPVGKTPAGNRLEDRSFTFEPRGDSLEINLRFQPGNSKSCGIRLRKSDDGKRSVSITYSGNMLDVAGTKIKVDAPDKDDAIALRIFLDHSVLEVYLPDGRVITKVISAEPDDLGIETFATGGWATFGSADVWPMSSAWKE